MDKHRRDVWGKASGRDLLVGVRDEICGAVGVGNKQVAVGERVHIVTRVVALAEHPCNNNAKHLLTVQRRYF